MKICKTVVIPLLGFSTLYAPEQLQAQTAIQDTVRIFDTTQEPYPSLVHQEVHRKRLYVLPYKGISTGFMVAPGVLLTSAHNLHSPFGSKVVRYVGHKGRSGSFDGERFELNGRKANKGACWIPQAYGWNDFANDFAILRLPMSAGTSTVVFELAIADDVVHVGDTVFVCGYPKDRKKLDGDQLILSKGVVLKPKDGDELLIRYDNWTEGGNSGSPVWVKRDGRFLVVGVHAGESKGTTVARKVDQALMQAVANW